MISGALRKADALAQRKRTHAETARTSPAASLIADAKATHGASPLCAEGVAALREIWAHNDSLPRTSPVGRVSSDAAVKMLRDNFGYTNSASSRNSLNALCRMLGRKSWGTP